MARGFAREKLPDAQMAPPSARMARSFARGTPPFARGTRHFAQMVRSFARGTPPFARRTRAFARGKVSHAQIFRPFARGTGRNRRAGGEIMRHRRGGGAGGDFRGRGVARASRPCHGRDGRATWLTKAPPRTRVLSPARSTGRLRRSACRASRGTRRRGRRGER
jgi:hypothetical protein